MPSIALPVSLRGQLLSGVRSAVTVFSPADLFATGSQGIWLDPSDLTTMFSDRAGTTPVTAPGTVVGLRLDKSKGLVLGAELTDTANAISAWTVFGTNALAQDGDAVRVTFVDNALGAFMPLKASGGLTEDAQIGKTYLITAEIKVSSAASVFWRLNNGVSVTDVSTVTSTDYTTVSAYMGVQGSAATTPNIQFSGMGSGEIVWIRNISVRELPGNHAVAPTDAARPIYGVEPKGGRRNLLTYSEAFNESVWSDGGQFSSPISANVSNSPVDTMTADRVTLSSATTGRGRRQDVSGFSSASSAVSVWVKAADTGSATHIRLTTNNTVAWNTGQSVKVALTTSWQRISLSGALIASGSSVRVIVGVVDVAGSVDTDCYGDVLIWGAQLELGSTATPYQRVTTAYDVTESGVATCHYVQYDGSDDSMSTSAIDFTATDKMSVFAGVRKLSDAAIGIVAELSADWFMNNGSIALASPNTVAANFGWNSRGSLSVIGTTSNSFPAPTTQVLSGVSSISEDILRLRQNGVQTLNVTSDQGTGNYGNYPLFFGRRNNATLPFNGRDYGIIIVGKAASAGEITDTELWLSDKTSEVDVAKSISPNIYTRSGDTILDRANSIIERRTV